MRRVLAPAAVVLVIVAFVTIRPAAAQTVTAADLAQAALSADDVAGFSQVGEQTLNVPGAIDVLFVRFFSERSSRAVLAVELILPTEGVSADEIAPSTAGETLLRAAARTFAATSGTETENFAIGGPLGIADDDLSVSWDARNGQTGSLLHVSGDVFLQGRLLAVTLFSTPNDTPDSTQIAGYARLQQSKILNSALPASLIGADR